MDPMLDGFERLAAGIAFGEPRVPLVSNLTGRVVGHALATEEVRGLRELAFCDRGLLPTREAVADGAVLNIDASTGGQVALVRGMGARPASRVPVARAAPCARVAVRKAVERKLSATHLKGCQTGSMSKSTP
jgi:acyl transferase domain-containing protein